MINLIIGKSSNLSLQLAKKMDNVVLVSAKDILGDSNFFDALYIDKVNVIFNNFQTASKLNDISNPKTYVDYSIGSTADVLTRLIDIDCNINKVIYTSSSSVYGNNIFCKECDEVKPISLHAALKVANEKLVQQFCKYHDIDYTIARIFNMYGGNDTFSVISKLLKCCEQDREFTITNHGSAIRDFIHIEDVVSAYVQLLNVDNIPILNIGTGDGTSIKNMIELLKLNNVNIKVKNINKDEIKMSTADNSLLMRTLDINNFTKIADYLLEKIR